MTISLVIVGIILCVLLSAYFSGSEMSFSACNKIRLENEADKENKEGNDSKANREAKKAKRALALAEDFDDTLSTILVGNNLVNIAASSLTTVFVILLTGSDKFNWVGTLAVTILIIIFGETIPKIYCKENSNRSALAAANSMTVLKAILTPVTFIVVGLVNLITKPLARASEGEDEDDESQAELQSLIETAEDEGVLDSERSEMVAAAIDFSDISAGEVMTPRVDMQAIDINSDREQILETVLSSTHSRIPIYEDNRDNILGIAHLNHILKALADDENADIRDVMMEACYVYKTTKLPQVLDTLKKKRQHLAIVTDEYSATVGVVSMEDVLEQIVGDIWDETDTVEEEVVQVSEDEFKIDGDMLISDFLELIGIPEDEFDYESSTVGGFAIEFLGDYPELGATFEYEGYSITVTEVEERRVTELLVVKEAE